MTAIEVGHFFWFVGFAVLALLNLLLFFLARKEGADEWVQWQKIVGRIVFLRHAFYWEPPIILR